MAPFRPKCITFDCYGTLINVQMAEAARDIYGSQLDAPKMADAIVRHLPCDKTHMSRGMVLLYVRPHRLNF